MVQGRSTHASRHSTWREACWPAPLRFITALQGCFCTVCPCPTCAHLCATAVLPAAALAGRDCSTLNRNLTFGLNNDVTPTRNWFYLHFGSDVISSPIDMVGQDRVRLQVCVALLTDRELQLPLSIVHLLSTRTPLYTVLNRRCWAHLCSPSPSALFAECEPRLGELHELCQCQPLYLCPAVYSDPIRLKRRIRFLDHGVGWRRLESL